MLECKGGTIKKAEHQIIGAFELWCWRRPEDCKEIQPVHPRGNQSWVFIGRTDAEAKAPIFWSPDERNWLIGKDPDAGKGWRWEEKGMTENEMVGWNHRLDEHESEKAPGIGDGEGGLACWSSWGHKESASTERLKWTGLPCPVLTGVSWLASRFFRKQVRWSDIPISLRIVHNFLLYPQSKHLV